MGKEAQVRDHRSVRDRAGRSLGGRSLARTRRFRSLAAVAATSLIATGLTATLAAAPAQAATNCSVKYALTSQWSGGFIADVTLTNTGDPWTSWTVAWTYGAGQAVTSAWNATVTQSGTGVTATNAAWNGGVATGGTAAFGFQGTYPSSNAVPSAFSVNGVACGSGTTATTTTSQVTTTTTTPTSTTTTRPTTTTPTSTTTTRPTTTRTTTTRPTTTTPTSTTTTRPTTTRTTTTRPTTTTTTTTSSNGKQLVVATSGNDSNAGTVAWPLRTIQKAIDLATAGTVIEVRGGTYALTANLSITKSGTSTAPYTLRNWTGERVIVDGEALAYTPGAVDSTIPNAQRGNIHMEASWWRITGIELINGPYGIFCRDCSNNVFERLVTRDNYESGFQLQGAASNNQILNLDSSGNRDPRKNGESADGLAIKEGSGSGNVVRGARLWNNVDDGFDAWEFASPISIENSAAWGNGYNRWNISGFSGDGNGFKMGGGDAPIPSGAHIVSNTMSFQNAAAGYTDNGNPGSETLDHNTAWQNVKAGFVFNRSTSTLTGNLSVGNASAVSLGSSISSGNSWDLGGTWTFVSTSSGILTGPRTFGGTISSSNFLWPSNGANVGARL